MSRTLASRLGLLRGRHAAAHVLDDRRSEVDPVGWLLIPDELGTEPTQEHLEDTVDEREAAGELHQSEIAADDSIRGGEVITAAVPEGEVTFRSEAGADPKLRQDPQLRDQVPQPRPESPAQLPELAPHPTGIAGTAFGEYGFTWPGPADEYAAEHAVAQTDRGTRDHPEAFFPAKDIQAGPTLPDHLIEELDRLRSDRDRLAAVLGCSSANEVIALVAGLREHLAAAVAQSRRDLGLRSAELARKRDLLG